MDNSTWINTGITEIQLIPYKIVLVFCQICGLYHTYTAKYPEDNFHKCKDETLIPTIGILKRTLE